MQQQPLHTGLLMLVVLFSSSAYARWCKSLFYRRMREEKVAIFVVFVDYCVEV